MPVPQTTTGRHTPLLRVLGFVVAAGLGIVGVWLIVTGNSSKNVRIGAISAFWGLLIGTYAVFGSRLPSRPADPAPAAPQPPPPSRELDVRQISEIERSALAAARREFAQELQLMLRRETQAGFAQEVAGLRAEVTALRNELVEKVGGQLRLERIETTRLIGSDLEALQSELRKLRERTPDLSSAQPPQLPAAIPVPQPHEIHEAEIVSDGVHVTAPVGPHLVEPVQRAPEPAPPVARPTPPPSAPAGGPSGPWPTAPPTAPPSAPRTAPPAAPRTASPAAPRTSSPAASSSGAPPARPPAPPARAPAARPAAAGEAAPRAARVEQPAQPERPAERPAPAPKPEQSADPFAGMPRITPFTDFALDPIPAPSESDSGSGRRHRADNDSNDVLARILAREQH